MTRTEDAAAIIIAARRDHVAICGLPETCAPRDLEEGYAVQKAVIDGWSDDVAGWKVGATAPATMDLFGTDEPFYGPVFAGDIFRSPARLDPEPFHVFGVEAEFAFVFARDLPPVTSPLTRDEIAGYIGKAHVAIEFVSPRLDKPAGYGAAQLIADTAGNGAVVIGPEISGWREKDLAAEGAQMIINGSEVARGTGADVLGHPLESLAWFAARAGGHGHTIRSGATVITGTCTGLHMAAPGARIVADFGGLGAVSLDLV